MREHSPLPWKLRPHELDDWGTIRGADNHVACIARSTTYNNEEVLDVYRRTKTDPTLPNAAYIVQACNAFPALVKALELANTFFELTDGNSKDEMSIAVVHNEIRAAIAKAKAGA